MPQHWNYFLALEDDLGRMSRYLEPTQTNFDAYSLELARILFAAASEVDVVAKRLCEKLDPTSSANNITEYRIQIMALHPEIAVSRIFIPKFGLSLTPWEQWKSGASPVWWKAYNNVKHQRHTHFSEANLKNTLNAVTGLFALLLFFYKNEAHNGTLAPNPELLRAGEPFQVDNLFYPPHTFSYRLVPDLAA